MTKCARCDDAVLPPLAVCLRCFAAELERTEPAWRELAAAHGIDYDALLEETRREIADYEARQAVDRGGWGRGRP